MQPRDRECIVVMNPTSRPYDSKRGITVLTPPTLALNRSMSIIVWNCRGGNSVDFRRNFRALLDWHQLSLVALVETTMEDHLNPLLETLETW